MMEQHRKVMLGCSMFCFLVMGAMYFFAAMWRNSSYEELIEHSEEVPAFETGVEKPSTVLKPPQPAQTPEREIQQLRQARKFDEALQLCRRYLQEGTADGRKAALQHMPDIHNQQVLELLNQRAYGQARASLDAFNAQELQLPADMTPELRKRWFDTSKNLRENWRRSLEERQRQALDQQDEAVVDAVTEELRADESADLQHAYLPFMMQRWKKARDAGKTEEAARLLRLAADAAAGQIPRVESYGFARSAVEEALRREIQGDLLLEEGKRLLAAGDYVMSSCYLLAFREPDNVKFPADKTGREALWLERLQRRLPGAEALMGLARQGLEGRLRFLRPDIRQNTLENVLNAVIHLASDVERFDKRSTPPAEKFRLMEQAWQLKFEVQLKRLARQLEAGEHGSAESFAQSILKQDSQHYRLSFRQQYFKDDLWSGVPADLRAEIQQKAQTPQQQTAELMNAVNAGRWIPDFPGKAKVIDIVALAMARRGIELLERDPANAYRAFRDVLRGYPQTQGALDILAALEKAIKAAKASGDFNRLYDHAAFYIGELGAGGVATEVREELANCLQTAADHYKKDSPMKRVFMLSLLADVLAGDPRGQAAASEATTLGLQATAKLPLDKPRPADLVLPSGLGGLSVVGINNATSYHLMVFFEGPEKFFVRFNPYRRGCVLLQDGTYTSAVIVTSDEVQPYRGQSSYNGQYAQHKYVIVTRDSTGRETGGTGIASGPYALLRTPPGAGAFDIDPQSGLVRKK